MNGIVIDMPILIYIRVYFQLVFMVFDDPSKLVQL